MISRVLVPMDDSETAERTVRYALEAYSDVEITALLKMDDSVRIRRFRHALFNNILV